MDIRVRTVSDACLLAVGDASTGIAWAADLVCICGSSVLLGMQLGLGVGSAVAWALQLGCGASVRGACPSCGGLMRRPACQDSAAS